MDDITNKKVALDLDGDGKSDLKIDIKFLGLLVGGIISLTMTYSQLTYLIKEFEKFEDQTNKRLEALEDRVYKR